MKFVSATLLTFMLMLTACQQEPDEVLEPDPDLPVVTPNTGNMKATIDGKAWVANRGVAAYRMNGLISISGISTDRKVVTITLTDKGVGEYVLNTVEFNAGAYVDSAMAQANSFGTNASEDPALAGGKVNITSIDAAKKTFSGTFTFRVYREDDNKSISFTNGSFTDVSFQTSLPSGPAGDTLRVKVDGVQFNPDFVASVNAANKITVTGSNAAGTKTVAVFVPSSVNPGTYQFSGILGDYMGTYAPDQDPLSMRIAETGKLIILEHNKTTHRYRGTFEFHGQTLFDATKASELTEGYFSVKYP